MDIPYNLIREHYNKYNDLIMIASKKGRWHCPYFGLVDFVSLFTPIENAAWGAIRMIGKLPLYPQYPVGKYFADFANPFLKISIECDGHEYHLDHNKDIIRDNYFIKEGWKVYRISGADCNRIIELMDEFDTENNQMEADEIINKYYRTTIEGLITSLVVMNCNLYATEEEINLSKIVLKSRLSNFIPIGNSQPNMYESKRNNDDAPF